MSFTVKLLRIRAPITTLAPNFYFFLLKQMNCFSVGKVLFRKSELGKLLSFLRIFDFNLLSFNIMDKKRSIYNSLPERGTKKFTQKRIRITGLLLD